MIVQATKPVRGKTPRQINESKIKVVATVQRKYYNIPDRRFLICTDPIVNGISGYVFDVKDQKIVYKVTTTKDVDEVYKDIYRTYKRGETTIVDPMSLRSVINKANTPKGNNEALTFNTVKRALNEVHEIKLVDTTIEPAYIRRIRDTYKYMDKYRIKLDVEVKHDSKHNRTTLYLFDDVAGVSKGTHRLFYEHELRRYSYFYMDKLIGQSSELENIFKI